MRKISFNEDTQILEVMQKMFSFGVEQCNVTRYDLKNNLMDSGRVGSKINIPIDSETMNRIKSVYLPELRKTALQNAMEKNSDDKISLSI